MPQRSLYDDIQTAVRYLRERISALSPVSPLNPTIGVVLGTGLGDFVKMLQNPIKIPYGLIPGFPMVTTDGHDGVLWVGMIGDKCVAVMQGRVHFYEGHSAATVVFPIRVLIALGCKTMIFTNAAGGIRQCLEIGDLTVVEDHDPQWFPVDPLIGASDERIGPDFQDLSEVYSPGLVAHAQNCADELGQDTLRPVLYAAVTGRSYETTAQIRSMDRAGIWVVGMSLILEAIAAIHMGARVLALNVVTDKPPHHIGQAKISHEAIKAAASRAEAKLSPLLARIIETMPS